MLRPIFVALPMERNIDAEGLLAGYFIALDGIPLDAVASVVGKLIKGTWSDDIRFCPRPPELAAMARREAVAMRERATPRLSIAKEHSFKDLRITARQRAAELQRQGYVLVAQGITRDTFPALAKSRAIPAGSVHLWAIDEVWAPGDVAHLVDTDRVESKRGQGTAAIPEVMTDEAAEYWARIEGLKDAEEVTPEQMAYRRKIEAMMPPAVEEDEAQVEQEDAA